LTQSGHSESVVRGQPSAGDDFSQLFSIGPEAHGAWNDSPRDRRVTAVHAVQAALAALVTTASRALVMSIPNSSRRRLLRRWVL
jgi:hypothetical protein